MYKQLNKEKNLVTFSVTADKTEFDAFITKAYEQNKSKFNVQGFRKGKAPRKVIEQNYGKDVFMEDALLEMANAEYQKIISENLDLKPVARPEIEVVNVSEQGAEIKIFITVQPEVKLGAYTGLEIEKSQLKVEDAQISAELEQIRARQARFVPVEREVKMGDVTEIDFVGRVDGKEFDGGKAENYRLEIGSNSFIPGFEDQIVGMNIGEKRTINVKFPDDYFSNDLKGKPAEFDVTLNKLEEKQLPELNDDLASSVSEFNTLEELKADIKKNLEESVKNQNRQNDENKIVETIMASTEIDIPEAMIQSQIDAQVQDFKERLSYQGFELEQYLEMIGQTMQTFRATQRELAEKSVKSQLVMTEIIKQEKLEVTKEDLEQKMQEIATKYEKTLEEYKKSISQYELNYITNDIIITKLFDFLFKNNNLK